MKRFVFLSLGALSAVYAQEVPLADYLNHMDKNQAATMAGTDALLQDVEKALSAKEEPLESGGVLQNKIEITSSKPFDLQDEKFEEALDKVLDEQAPAFASAPVSNPAPVVVHQKVGKMIRYPFAILDVLNKISGHRTEIKVPVGKSIVFERLDIAVYSCQVRPPQMDPEEGVALRVMENVRPSVSTEIFKGWMFKSKRSVSTMHHPLYDVWLQGCQMPEVPKAVKSEKALDKTPSEAQKEAKKKDKKIDVKKTEEKKIDKQPLSQAKKAPARANLEAVY